MIPNPPAGIPQRETLNSASHKVTSFPSVWVRYTVK